MRRINYQRKLKAFTLYEVLIVLVIIGILVLIAMPRLMPVITQAKSTEAKLQLQHAHALMKNHFFTHAKYTSSLDAIGFEQETLVDNGGPAKYLIEVVQADQTSFLIRATSVEDFDGDGTFNVWEIDQDKRLTETVKD